MEIFPEQKRFVSLAKEQKVYFTNLYFLFQFQALNPCNYPFYVVLCKIIFFLFFFNNKKTCQELKHFSTKRKQKIYFLMFFSLYQISTLIDFEFQVVKELLFLLSFLQYFQQFWFLLLFEHNDGKPWKQGLAKILIIFD